MHLRPIAYDSYFLFSNDEFSIGHHSSKNHINKLFTQVALSTLESASPFIVSSKGTILFTIAFDTLPEIEGDAGFTGSFAEIQIDLEFLIRSDDSYSTPESKKKLADAFRMLADNIEKLPAKSEGR